MTVSKKVQQKPDKKNKGGRPKIVLTQEIADRICEKIATSDKGLTHILNADDSLPGMFTVYKWLREYEWFSKQYARAREDQADFMADQIIDISDDSTNDTLYDDEGNERINQEWVQRSRLRIDARKWKASKLAPKKYGDKIDLTSGDAPISLSVSVSSSETEEELNKLSRKHKQK